MAAVMTVNEFKGHLQTDPYTSRCRARSWEPCYDEASRRWYALPGSSHLIGDNWCDDALEAEKFGMEVVVQLPAAALR